MRKGVNAMNGLNVWKFALAASATFAALSAVCAVAVILWPDATVVQQLVSRPGPQIVGAAGRQAGDGRPVHLRQRFRIERNADRSARLAVAQHVERIALAMGLDQIFYKNYDTF